MLEDLRFLRDVSTRQEGPMPFRNLDLQGMNLSGLRFPCRDDEPGVEGGCGVRADFTDANLSDAVMRNMDLTGADFTRADLQGADLGGSLLTDADLTAARNLDAAELEGVCYVTGNAVIWPSALGMPESMTGDPNSPLCSPGM
jgi:uncharacterized protein YjbI with pentapeptide repeats